MCTNNIKTLAAIYILRGLLQDRNVNEEKNVKLMKLIYLFFIKYVSLCENFVVPNTSPIRFAFTAMEKGPVEDNIYNNISYIRTELVKNVYTADYCGINPEEQNKVDKAIAFTSNYFSAKSVDELVEITHNGLSEWRKTPLFGQMNFDDGFAKEIESLHRITNQHAA